MIKFLTIICLMFVSCKSEWVRYNEMGDNIINNGRESMTVMIAVSTKSIQTIYDTLDMARQLANNFPQWDSIDLKLGAVWNDTSIYIAEFFHKAVPREYDAIPHENKVTLTDEKYRTVEQCKSKKLYLWH